MYFVNDFKNLCMVGVIYWDVLSGGGVELFGLKLEVFFVFGYV